LFREMLFAYRELNLRLVYGPPNRLLKKPPRLCGRSKDSA